MARHFGLSALITILLVAGSSAPASGQGDPVFGYRLELDVVYGQGLITRDGAEVMRDLRMDVYSPSEAGDGPWPAVIYVHGGAWHRGGPRNPPYRDAGAVHSSPEDWARLLAAADQALAIDRDFAEGHAGTAKAYASLGYFNILPPAEAWPLAEEGAERALELNEDLAEAHATLARVRAWFEWDWEGAEGEFRRAIELNPSDAEVREWFALFLASIGKSEEAIHQSAQAVTLNPRSVLARFFQMSTLAYAGRIVEARTMAEAAVEKDPLEPVFYWWIAVCRSSEGEFERAIPALLTQIGLMGGDVSDELGFLGYLYGRNDQRNRAMEALEQMNDRVREGVYVSPVAFACVHIGLDDYEEAMAWLSRGFDSKANWMLTLKFHPLFESIREEPDFVELEKRMGLRSE